MTAHCLVKNEENFIGYAIRSVLDFVDHVIVFDTGSTDNTRAIIHELARQYPAKISFEEKGECTKDQHTQLRNEMIGRTKTDWFMILDGDEVWPTGTLEEARKRIASNSKLECLMTPFFLCVGDVYHQTVFSGSVEALGRTGFFYQRFVKKTRGVHWKGAYNSDTIYDESGQLFFNDLNTEFMDTHFWHATHLRRSRVLTDFSSGAIRGKKMILTYFMIGKKINEPAPEVFNGENLSLDPGQSFVNFFGWFFSRLLFKFNK